MTVTPTSWRVHGARPSRHVVAPGGACGDDLAFRGAAWHLLSRFFFRNVEVGGSSPLTSTSPTPWRRSSNRDAGARRCRRRGVNDRYFGDARDTNLATEPPLRDNGDTRIDRAPTFLCGVGRFTDGASHGVELTANVLESLSRLAHLVALRRVDWDAEEERAAGCFSMPRVPRSHSTRCDAVGPWR
jgi:hypothetical protein